jgi:hypothetical protein
MPRLPGVFKCRGLAQKPKAEPGRRSDPAMLGFSWLSARPHRATGKLSGARPHAAIAFFDGGCFLVFRLHFFQPRFERFFLRPQFAD